MRQRITHKAIWWQASTPTIEEEKSAINPPGRRAGFADETRFLPLVDSADEPRDARNSRQRLGVRQSSAALGWRRPLTITVTNFRPPASLKCPSGLAHSTTLHDELCACPFQFQPPILSPCPCRKHRGRMRPHISLHWAALTSSRRARFTKPTTFAGPNAWGFSIAGC